MLLLEEMKRGQTSWQEFHLERNRRQLCHRSMSEFLVQRAESHWIRALVLWQYIRLSPWLNSGILEKYSMPKLQNVIL